MIKIIDYVIDDIVKQYQNDVYNKKIDDISQVVYPSTNKKDKLGEWVRQYFVKLDSVIQDAVKQSGVKTGVVILGSKHTTSSVYVNHFEPGMLYDVLENYDKMFPVQKKYRHNEWDFEYKNGAAHLKSIALGKGSTVFIKNGDLVLGDFENIIYAEFDYRPLKSFNIVIMGE
ncbi:MAG: secondary thiamine-phosphate synthase enzyme YjbQ [Clostridiales bacterium]|nr:secondary thiamine-phosphate synthase enzyme YjbQ [Clostridiales bacterium]